MTNTYNADKNVSGNSCNLNTNMEYDEVEIGIDESAEKPYSSCYLNGTSQENDFLYGAKLPTKKRYLAHFPYTINSWIMKFIWKGSRYGVEEKEIMTLYSQHPYMTHFKSYNKTSKFKQGVHLKSSIVEASRNTIIICSVFKFLSDTATIYSPFLVYKLLQRMNRSEDVSSLIFLCFMIFLVSLISTISNSYYVQLSTSEGLSIRLFLDFLIYEKLLKLSKNVKNHLSSGKIINLVSTDTHNIELFAISLNNLWLAPLNILLISGFLFYFMGASILSNFVFLLLSFIIQRMLSNKMMKKKRRLLELSDKRIEIIREVIQEMKIIKSYVLEDYFKDAIERVRNEEMVSLRSVQILKCYHLLISLMLPIIGSISTFAIYKILGNELSPEIVFPSIALFNLLKIPISALIPAFFMLSEVDVSVKRIESFFKEKEVVDYVVNSNDTAEKYKSNPDNCAVIIKDGEFVWMKDSSSNDRWGLRDINIRIPKGKITAIVGKTGSGKTALLQSIVGEIEKIRGEVIVFGSVSYCPSKIWIMNASIRENITMGRRFDKNHYEKVLRDCLLVDDIDKFKDKDLTLTGEKGVDLSEGQKKRLGITRVCYSDGDIFMMDDPFSSLYWETVVKIFDGVIMERSPTKTIVFTTNNIEIMKMADFIINLENGRVTYQGESVMFFEKDGYKKFEKEYEKVRDNCDTNLEDELKIQERSMDYKDLVKGRLLWRDYVAYFKHFGGKIFISILMVSFLLFNVSKIYVNFWLPTWVRFKYKGLSDLDYIVIYLLLAVFYALSYLFYYYLLIIVSCTRASKKIHKNIIDKILKANLLFLYDTTSGFITSRFSRDIGVVDRLLPNIIGMVTSSIGRCIILFSSIIIVTPINGVILLPIVSFYYLIQSMSRKVLMELNRLNLSNTSRFHSHFSETIDGIETIRTFKMQDKYINMSKSLVQKITASSYIQLFLQRWLDFRLAILGNLIVLIVSISCILLKIDTAFAGLLISNLLVVSDALVFCIKQLVETEIYMNSVERLNSYSKGIVLERNDTEITINSIGWISEGSIEFRNVTMNYRSNGNPALKNISFKIKSGEKVKILGETGAGKSSIVLALLRIIDITDGEIFVDGVSITKIDRKVLRSDITLISQDPVLFHGTIRSNIDQSNSKTDEEIYEVLKKTYLDKFISSLENGLSTAIRDGGKSLSIGQRQLILFAKAILKNTKVLVMDEATSNLDKETCELIEKSILNHFKSATLLSITHSRNSLIKFDQEIIIKGGSIV